MISVLCPSRGRPGTLLASAASLLDLARDPAAVEILVAADPDDDFTLGLAQDGSWPDSARLWVAPGRYGYSRMHEYVNALAGMAEGEWLMLWNDDGIMLTGGWDTIIHGQEPGVLKPWASWAWPQSNTFPAWPAAWTRRTGHVSLAWCCDTWMQEIGRMLGMQRDIPVRIRHDRYEDRTAAEGRHAADVGAFWAAGMARLREDDAASIRALLAGA